MKRWHKDLAEFISLLEKAGEIKKIDTPVSPCVEISKYTDEQSKSPGGGKALFFTNVEGSDFPVATNLFGSNRRICLALGVNNLDGLGDRVRSYLTAKPPASLKEALGLAASAFSVTRFFPRKFRGKAAPCQEEVMTGDKVDLSTLPVLTCWPGDAGPFVTLPLVFTKSLVTGCRNLGMYRLQIFDKNTTGMHWHLHKDGSHFFNEYKKAGRKMPVSVAIGADPATIYAATAPMPRNVDEMILAGFIRNKPVAMVKCVTNDLLVPARAEFVLEGYVNPDELRREGPFGDHTGYYSLADDYPVFHVTAITRKKHPVYCATLVGRPPMEDCYLAKATERLFLPLLQAAFPEIKDYWLPWEGVFHNIVIVSIEKEFPMHAQKVMHGLWGQGQMSFCKAIVVVDHDVDPKDGGAVMDRLLAVLDPESDMVAASGVLDVLDHSAPSPFFGRKLGLDLTRRAPGEPERRQPEGEGFSISDAGEILKQIQREIPEITGLRVKTRPGSPTRLVLFNADKTGGKPGREIARLLLSHPTLKGADLMVMFDPRIDLKEDSLVLWKLFNNTDPGRDIQKDNGRICVDACKKYPWDGHERQWPDDLRFE